MMFGTGVCAHHYVCFVIMYSIKTTGDTVNHFGLNCWLQPPKIFHGVDVAPLKKRLGTPGLDNYHIIVITTANWIFISKEIDDQKCYNRMERFGDLSISSVSMSCCVLRAACLPQFEIPNILNSL